MTTPHAPDDERLPGEDELSSLYGRLPPIEPPTALDAAVRRAAAAAVQPAATPRRRARWPVALSSAAALVVAAGLAWRMGQMPGKQDALHEAAVRHEARTIAVPVPQAVTPIAPAKPAAETYARAEKAQVSRKVATAPPRVLEEASRQAPSKLVAPAPPPPPAPPAPPTEMMQAPMPTAAPPPMAQEALPAPAPVVELDARRADTPEQELRKIRDLFAAHRRDDARKRLADFHRDHPDYELPDDLREQLLQP
jgi:Meckel syndrome type 1 protein